MRTILYAILSAVLMIAASCDKGVLGKKKFGWLDEGTKLYYDYYTPAGTRTDVRRLLIGSRIFEQELANSDVHELMFRVLDRDFIVKRDGLYGVACESCGMGIITCLSEFEFLYAPNKARQNQELREYDCGRDSYSINKIIEVDKTVTVPKGTFKTYVILHPNGDRSYWNPDEGLIQYDRYNYNGAFIGSLKLNRIER